MNSFKIGLASVTFRNKTVLEIVEIAKKAGVDYIEWGADVHVKTAEDAQKAKELCEFNGIKISSYGSYYRVGSCDGVLWEQICKIAQILGAASVRVWLGEKDSEKTSEEEYEVLFADLKSICETAEKYKLFVCPECHDNTFNNNTDAIIKLKNQLNKDNFRTYFQSRYFRFNYDIDRIERTFDFIENVHVSYRDLKREQRFRKKDKNYLDKLLKKLLQMDFKGLVIVEFTKGSKEKNFIKDVKKLKSY
ncbi:MAG: TIM barrel protein [Clostridia bacterium]|nr:TIM barrel protein [Clostridia bacterium]MBQ7046562.1 TIM barrel protein [Oscillospiraceae bacterium]